MGLTFRAAHLGVHIAAPMAAAALCLLLLLSACAPGLSAAAVIPVSGQSGLDVREYPLVEQSKDNPTSPAFQRYVPEAVASQREGWVLPTQDDALDHYNQALTGFGFYLKENQSPPFSSYTLYHDGLPIQQDIARFWPVSIKPIASGGSRDFLLPFLTLSGEKLVASADGVRPWPGQPAAAGDQARTAPVYYGDQIAYAQTGGGQVSVYAGPSLLYAASDAGQPQADSAARNLHTWGGEGADRHWALEMDGRVVIDGVDINAGRGYEKVFDFRVIDGQPFYFFTHDGITRIHYAGRDLPYRYDQVVHYQQGELQSLNPGSTGRLVWFYALRDGLWYYVEAGLY